MFGIYKTKLFDFVRFRGHYELISEFAEKSFEEFTQRSDYYIKITDSNDPELTDIFDVKLWIKHDTKVKGFSEEWNVALDGYGEPVDGKIPILCNGTPDGWEVVEKYVGRKYVDQQEIEGAWITYTYKKKDGVILDQPLEVREDITVEKLLELRRFYGGTL